MKILLCPLNWGLGHATRCVPIVDCLLRQGHQVTLGSNGRSLAFLKGQFPQLKTYDLPGYDITYPVSSWGWLFFIFQLPGFLWGSVKEHFALKNIVRTNPHDLIISDNRYGIYLKSIPSIFITHQLHIMFPKIQMAGLSINKYFENILEFVINIWLQRFTQVWVPDRRGAYNLSGALSHVRHKNLDVKFISFLSRFHKNFQTEITAENGSRPIKILSMISGPEPQRSIFEKIILQQLNSIPGRHVMVVGKPEEYQPLLQKRGEETENVEGVEIYPHIDTENLQNMLQSAEIILCRPGYSTLMELAVLQKEKMILIPTPGQTEQIYLADFLETQLVAPHRRQKGFTLTEALNDLDNYQGFRTFPPDDFNFDSFITHHPLFKKK